MAARTEFDLLLALASQPGGGPLEMPVNHTRWGLPAEALPRTFDRFYRADTARAGGNTHGAGLGLAIVHAVLAAHGGRISVRSAEGRGTGFVVHLPLPPTP
jgi:two-component system OmpR family sensor kinase